MLKIFFFAFYKIAIQYCGNAKQNPCCIAVTAIQNLKSIFTLANIYCTVAKLDISVILLLCLAEAGSLSIFSKQARTSLVILDLSTGTWVWCIYQMKKATFH